jgi:hypothetical protein
MRIWGGRVLIVLLFVFPSIGSATEDGNRFVELVGFDQLRLDGACKEAVVTKLKELAYRVREPIAVSDFETLPPSDQRIIRHNQANAGGSRMTVTRTGADLDEWRFTFVDGDNPTVQTSAFTDTEGCRRALRRLTPQSDSLSRRRPEQDVPPPPKAASASPANPSTPTRQNATPTRAIQAESVSPLPPSVSSAPVRSEWSKWHFAIDLGYRRTEQSEDGNYYNANFSTDEDYQSEVIGESLALSFGASRLISVDLSWFVAGGMLFTNWIDAEENSLKIQTDETGLMLRGGAEYQVFRSVRVEAAVELMRLPDLTRGSFSLGATFDLTTHLGLGARIGVQSESGSGADDNYEYNWSATGVPIDCFVRLSF